MSILNAGLVSSNRKTFTSWIMPNTSDLLVIKLTGLSSQTCGSRITRNRIEEFFFSLHSAEMSSFFAFTVDALQWQHTAFTD